MPSFDVVSEVDLQEVTNAVDQANREISSRYDFRNVAAGFENQDGQVTLFAEAEIQLNQMVDILRNRFVNRKIDPGVMDIQELEHRGKQYYRRVLIQQGIETDLARKIVKTIKDRKMKVQVSIQGDKVRVSGKKKNDLQNVISILRDSAFDIPLQFNNFRD
ncbi:MAG: YajQ family cyclic di-GMP-binding protein [Gammaproteobacteria bacterium]|nr:YajQ family cyclic di-GMP-binding protein [Gammaproteobacteria bacterium]